MNHKAAICRSISIFLTIFLGFSNLVMPVAAASILQPSNDDFADAQQISGSTGSVTGTNYEATKETSEPHHAGNTGGASLWYYWQAPTSGYVELTTEDSLPDTLLGVYTGQSVDALTEIASNDDANPGTYSSRVVFNAVADTVYYIALDGYNGSAASDTDALTLHWTLGVSAPSPSPSPSPMPANKIVFDKVLNDGSADIFVMNADGTNQTNLTNSSETFDYTPTWSPDGTKLAFVSEPIDDYDSEIFVMDADGSDLFALTDDEGQAYAASWSPDGSKVVYLRNVEGDVNICVVNADGTNPTRLTPTSAIYDKPMWSPDGTQIAFEAYTLTDPNNQVYVMDADGSNIVNISNNLEGSYRVRWIPGTSRLSFIKLDSNNNRALYAVNADGTGLARLSPDPTNEDDYEYSWSPDGTQVILSAYNFDTMRYVVCVMDADGSNRTQVVDYQSFPHNPRWSPDGAVLTFDGYSKDYGQSDIYRVNPDGSGLFNLTSNPESDDEHAWQPTN